MLEVGWLVTLKEALSYYTRLDELRRKTGCENSASIRVGRRN